MSYQSRTQEDRAGLDIVGVIWDWDEEDPNGLTVNNVFTLFLMV